MKIMIIILTIIFLATSCTISDTNNNYERVWDICIDNDAIGYDAWDTSDQVLSKMNTDFGDKECKVHTNGSTDVISCLGDAYFSIHCNTK